MTSRSAAKAVAARQQTRTRQAEVNFIAVGVVVEKEWIWQTTRWRPFYMVALMGHLLGGFQGYAVFSR